MGESVMDKNLEKRKTVSYEKWEKFVEYTEKMSSQKYINYIQDMPIDKFQNFRSERVIGGSSI